ncbi:hypothetical protein T12_4137 [Trichinella patagoniensis]|uniref:Uncharacterized protein n=1 Tax=Trichinella patagoniensis TaxID=990121 RepID=A0A0V1AGM4_9BILA|nr:hypothetical protein T12_4137 [Trichinella patagoniensis]
MEGDDTQLKVKGTYLDLKIVKKPEIDSFLYDMPLDDMLQ